MNAGALRRGGRLALLLVAASAGWAADLPADIQRAIQDLGAAQFKVRAAAVQQLETLATTDHHAVLAACLQAYGQSADPEVRWRAEVVLRQVVDKHLFRAPRGFLGVRLNNVIVAGGGQIIMNGATMPTGAVWIGDVLPDSSAQRAGLQSNDFILEVDGRKFERGPSGFTEYIQSKPPGEKVQVLLLRAQATNHLEVVLGQLPEAEQQKLYTDEASKRYFENWLQQQPGDAISH